MTGALLPHPGNNANLISKLVQYLQKEHEVRILAYAPRTAKLPDTLAGAKIHQAKDERGEISRSMLWPVKSMFVDPYGSSDAIMSAIILKSAKKLRREYPFDEVISTMEPFPAAYAGACLNNVKKVMYLMDPPEIVRGGKETDYRSRKLNGILKKQNMILTTPFIRKALSDNGYGEYDGKIVPVGFPMIEEHERGDSRVIRTDNGKINLLFCGWMYSDIRSPKYFLDIVSRLDERFCIYFMGKECDKLRERFDFETKAEVVTLPQQPYQTAIDAMFDADILINIGNSVPVHMPSKTLEYINTGKPMVNFYKFPDCPTKYYTDRYPLCLNIFEGDGDVGKTAKRFIDFCLTQKGKTVEREYIEREFADCTPQYIAQQILDKLGDK